MKRFLSFSLLVLVLWGAVPAARSLAENAPRTFYVNNRTGQDAFDGLAAEPAGDGKAGPLATIMAAVRKADVGSLIVVANTGEPYRERVSIEGYRKGRAARPLVIEGSGATVTGLVRVAPERWKALEGRPDVYWFDNAKESGGTGAMPNSNWLMFYKHDGWFNEEQAPRIFFVDGKPGPNALSLDEIPPGGFFYQTQQGRKLFYRLAEGQKIGDVKIELPLNSGVYVSDDYVVVRNLRSIYSQDDGFAGFWGIGVVFENVDGSYNCDQGISLHGYSTTTVDGGLFERNGGCGIADVMSCITVYRNCVIRDNLVTGALLQGHAHKLLGCRLYGNRDAGKRGATQVTGGAGTSVHLEQCLIVGDGSETPGTGVSIADGRINHCTFVGFQTGLAVGRSADVSNSIFRSCGGALVSAREGATLTMKNCLLDLGTLQIGKEKVTAETWPAFLEKSKAWTGNLLDAPDLQAPLYLLPAESPNFKAAQYNRTPGARLKPWDGWKPTPDAAPVEHP